MSNLKQVLSESVQKRVEILNKTQKKILDLVSEIKPDLEHQHNTINTFEKLWQETPSVCDVCGLAVSGGLAFAQMYQCVNGHTFCFEHSIEPSLEELKEVITQMLVKDLENLENRTSSTRDKKIVEFQLQTFFKIKGTIEKIHSMDWIEIIGVICDEHPEFLQDCPPEYCPVCSFNDLTYRTAALYLMKKHCYTEELLIQEIKENYKTYKDLGLKLEEDFVHKKWSLVYG